METRKLGVSGSVGPIRRPTEMIWFGPMSGSRGTLKKIVLDASNPLNAVFVETISFSPGDFQLRLLEVFVRHKMNTNAT
ncbi:hypothetical protein ACCT25_38070, partial [Rhizobium ruizarguesonis]